MPLLTQIPVDLPALVSDYLSQHKNLGDFASFKPDFNDLKAAAQQRSKISVDRATLVTVLKEQAARSTHCSARSKSNIDALLENDVFTITTGHQLCIYGGPMFFFYKIISTLKLCSKLEEEGIRAVPVYWMASEDHDFEEINHINIGQERLVWNQESKGPVGRLPLSTLNEFKDGLSQALAEDPVMLETLDEMDSLFSASKHLADAMRDFVYSLFSKHGIVVLDADDARLKSLFKQHIEAELTEQSALNSIEESNKKLEELGYDAQVNPREINLFWMEDGYRERIVQAADGFATADGVHKWSKSEMNKAIADQPACFSPNVVTRPLYQEVILPNLTYIGGPGEISYWLQLKSFFDQSQVFYPQLVLRDMAVLMDEKTAKRMQQLELDASAIHEEKDALFTRLIRKDGTHELLVTERKSVIEQSLESMIDELEQLDPTLKESASAEKTRILKRLEVLRKKVLRNDRKKNQILERQLMEWWSVVRPADGKQERISNWLNFDNLQTIDKRILELIEHFDPFVVQLKVFTDKK